MEESEKGSSFSCSFGGVVALWMEELWGLHKEIVLGPDLDGQTCFGRFITWSVAFQP